MVATPPLLNPANPFASPDSKVNIRYCVRLTDRGRPFHVVIVTLTVPRLCTPNRIRDMLNRKVVDYIQLRFPSQIGVNAQILGRVDSDI